MRQEAIRMTYTAEGVLRQFEYALLLALRTYCLPAS